MNGGRKLNKADMDADAVARLGVAPSRRWAALLILGILGAALLWIALAVPPAALGLRIGVLVGGLGALWLAVRLHAATGRGLVLTDAELREAGPGGRTLARLDRVRTVDRGALAFKPSNGFVLHLMPGAGEGRVWAPGSWWRIGNRVGVGGVLRAAESRAVAEAIALRLAD